MFIKDTIFQTKERNSQYSEASFLPMKVIKKPLNICYPLSMIVIIYNRYFSRPQEKIPQSDSSKMKTVLNGSCAHLIYNPIFTSVLLSDMNAYSKIKKVGISKLTNGFCLGAMELESTPLSIPHTKYSRKHLLLITMAMALLPACEQTNFYHGHPVSREKTRAFQVGRTTKQQVLESLGTPSTILSYDPHTLYYLSQVVANKALLPTIPLSSQCVALSFSPSGILSKIVWSERPVSLHPCPKNTPLPSQHQESFWQQAVRSFEQSAPEPKLSSS